MLQSTLLVPVSLLYVWGFPIPFTDSTCRHCWAGNGYGGKMFSLSTTKTGLRAQTRRWQSEVWGWGCWGQTALGSFPRSAPSRPYATLHLWSGDRNTHPSVVMRIKLDNSRTSSCHLLSVCYEQFFGGKTLGIAFQTPTYRTSSLEGGSACSHPYGGKADSFLPWDALDHLGGPPSRGHRGVCSQESVTQLMLSWVQNPASFLLSKGLLLPGQSGSCPEGSPAQQRRWDCLSWGEGIPGTVKIQGPHPFPRELYLGVKLHLQITQTLKLNNSVLSPCRGWAGKEGVL